MKQTRKKPLKNHHLQGINKDSNESIDTFDTWGLSKEELDRWDRFDEENERLFEGCFEF